MPGEPRVTVRPALPADVRAIRALVEPYAEQRILLAKEMVGYYEAVQEFLVADAGPGGPVIGCGAPIFIVSWARTTDAAVASMAVNRQDRNLFMTLLLCGVNSSRRSVCRLVGMTTG